MMIADYLQSRRVHHQVLLHRPASCASQLARSLHVPGRTVAKGVLVASPDGRHWLAVLPATHRVDLERLRIALGVESLLLATPSDLVRIFPDCELGALPPFGRLYGIPTIVDSALAGVSEIVCEGNLRHESVRLRYRDFEALENPFKARFAVVVSPRQPRVRRRRAG